MNNAIIFPPIPELGDFTMPCKWEEDALLDWLVDLSTGESKEACLETISALRVLKKTELPFKKRITLLQLINRYLKQYINRLGGACWDASFPLSAAERNYAELVTWNYLLLGINFYIAADLANRKSDAVYALAMAVDALSQAQLHIAATYFALSNGFWSNLYQIFAWAEKRKLHHLPVEEDELKGLTVNTLFVRSLIFQCCDANQFQSRDIRTIFNFLPKVCVGVPVEIYSPSNDMFMIDLKSDNPPLNVKAQFELGSDQVRYFSPVIVAKALQHVIEQGQTWTGALKSINDALFSRVVKTLGLKQKRRYRRQNENLDLLGVIGFEDIVSFLYKVSKNSVPAVSEPKPAAQPVEKAQAQSLGLSLEDSIYVQPPQQRSLNKTDQWQKQQDVIREVPMKKVMLKEIKVCDSSANGYSVSWNQSYTKVKIGDLFGIISEDKKRLEIAIIRRIALNTGSDFRADFRFGAEVLGFESEIAYMSSMTQPSVGVWAVFIPGIELLGSADTLIFSIGGPFSRGDTVLIHRRNKIVPTFLLKELHSTVAISHMELSYPKNA